MKSRMLAIGLLIFLFVFAGCKKDNSLRLKSQLAGLWELRYLFGFQDPGTGSSFAPGNGTTWKFTGSEFERFTSGQLAGSGTYTLIKEEALTSELPADAFILNQDAYQKFHFEIHQDTLTLYVGSIAADGYMAKYVKQ